MGLPLPAVDTRRLPGLTRAQLPFVISTAIVAVIVAVAEPAVAADPLYIAALVAVGVASALGVLLVPSSVPAGFLIIVPALDLIAVAVIRDVAADDVPASVMLVVFPLLWLVFAFPSGGVAVAIAGAALIGVVPILRWGVAPQDEVGWLDLIGTVLLTAFLVIAAAQAATLLRRNRRELAEATATQARLLADSREQTATIRDVADAVDVGIVYFDADDRPVVRNAAVRDMLALAGYDHVTGRASSVYGSDRVTPVARDGKIFVEALYADRVHGPVYWVGEPGDQRALNVLVRSIGRRPGRRGGSVLAAYDVTDLAQAVQVRDEFLATVSHELRTPLTSIVGYLDLLEELHDPEELGIAAEVQVIQRNVDQLSAIIGSLLAGADRAPALVRGRVDMSALVREAVDAARVRADEHGLELAAEIPPGVELDGDGERIAQVVSALLANAVVHTPAGSIRVALAAEPRDADGRGGDVVLSVVDTGSGISEEDQRHVFDRFFRAQTARDRALPGLGLGLSIAERVAEAHGGRIDITSRLGEGTTVRLRLPVAPPRALSDRAPDAPGEHGLGR